MYDHINNVLNQTPGPSAATIGINEVNRRLNRGEPPTGVVPPTSEEPPTGVVPSRSAASRAVANIRQRRPDPNLEPAPNLEGRRIPLIREGNISSPLDNLGEPAPNLGRRLIQTPRRIAPLIPQQAIQVDPIKEQLCVQLFGRSNNGCLELTMD